MAVRGCVIRSCTCVLRVYIQKRGVYTYAMKECETGAPQGRRATASGFLAPGGTASGAPLRLPKMCTRTLVARPTASVRVHVYTANAAGLIFTLKRAQGGESFISLSRADLRAESPSFRLCEDVSNLDLLACCGRIRITLRAVWSSIGYSGSDRLEETLQPKIGRHH